MSLRCAVAPGPVAPALAAAVAGGGGRLGDPGQAEALIWTDPMDWSGLRHPLAALPAVRWVQLPFAGVDRFLGLFDDGRTWTSTKGAYSEPVAEHALALALAGLRQLPRRARARAWGDQAGLRLAGAPVTIVGAGGITDALLRLLAPFGVEVTVVRRHVAPVGGAARGVGAHELDAALPAAVVVFLTLALTPETTGVMDARR